MPERGRQRSAALDRAQEARLHAARVRAQIRTAGPSGGAIVAARIVKEGSSSMRFFELVKAVPWIGEFKAKQMLARAQINPEARVRSDTVGERQLAQLQRREHRRTGGAGTVVQRIWPARVVVDPPHELLVAQP